MILGALLYLISAPVFIPPNIASSDPDLPQKPSSVVATFSLEDVAGSRLGNASIEAQATLDAQAKAKAEAEAAAAAAAQAAQQAEAARLAQVAAEAQQAAQASPATSTATFSGSDNDAMNYIFAHESGGRLTATNSEGCLGLGQACPASKLINACPDYDTNEQCQIDFFTGYANSRYGGWQGAYSFWLNNHWW